MSINSVYRRLLFPVAALIASAAFGQVDIQLRPRHLPGWDARTREGHCSIRVWVDHRAEVRMRGDTIFVRTLEGSRSRDEGSECSQPIPYNSVRDFQIRQTAGRSRVVLAQEPSRMNNYTGLLEIVDTQGGGDDYAFEVSWRADPDVSTAPAPFFDDVRACQDTVRARFLSQNGRGAYIDFDNFADRRGEDRGPGRRPGQYQNQYQGRNRGQETIQGTGTARRRYESRDITYSCVIDTRQNQVMSGVYEYSSGGIRMNDRPGDRGPLR